MKKRVLSMLMALALCLSLLPATALAAAPEEQFSGLTPGRTYWFDLSGAGIPGNKNGSLPDDSLHWVPFTYAGAVNAYKRTDAGVSTEDSVTPYDHSLFIAEYNVTHTVSWDTLNTANLIFGKDYASGGVDYSLRAPSAGSNGMDSVTPRSNEWDAILDKNSVDIKNWNGMCSWCQDTYWDEEEGEVLFFRAGRGHSSARSYSYDYATGSSPTLGFRPVLEVLNPDTLKSDGLKVVTLDLGGGKLGGSSDAIQIIVKTGSEFAAPASDGLNRPDGDTGSFFMWLGSDGKLYAPGDSVPADVTKLTAQFALSEQFSLKPDGTYYFDLSAMNIPGTANGNLPDSALHYVPFTYAGTIEAYKLTSATATTEEYAQREKYPHSLFVADYNVTHTVSWDDLNNEGLIFGKNYAVGGVDYTLRAPSVGSGSTGSGDSERIVPQSNEWDTMLNKDDEYIQNWNEMFSWGQDTYSGDASYRAVRGYYSARSWNWSGSSDRTADLGFRPVLEVLNPGTLGPDSLTTVTLDLNGGHVGRDATAVTVNLAVKSSGTYTAPSSDGLTRPTGNDDTYFKWQDSSGNFYEPGEQVPANVTRLTARWEKDVPTLTAPTANTLVYNGSAQALVTAGTTADGTMQYSLNNADWSDSVPTGKDAKTYTVYYKVVGDSNHTDSVPASVSVTIAPRSIADASVTLGESLTYNGSSQTQTVTVKLGEVDITSSCNVSNNVQTNAGSYTLTVTAKDNSNYTGSVTKDFTIAKKSITPTIAVSGTYTFTGSAITPAFTVKDGDTALTADDYTAVFADNINAGSGKVTVTEKTTGNYTFSEAQQSFTIGKAAAPTLDNISVSQKYTVTTQQSKDIGRAGMPDDAGTLAYAKGTEEEITYVSSWSVNNTTGEVTYTLSGGTAGDTVTLPIKITSTNYADSTVNVVITLTDKDVPTLTAPTANTLVYNGSAQALVTAGTTADGTMQYSLNNADWSDSVPTGKDAKTYTVYYKVVGDSNHTDSVPASVSVTIAPRSIADASVTLGESLTYNGSSQTQTVTVKLGEVDITSSCNVSNNVQTNAGSYTLTVTAKDNSNYTGSVTKDFTIAKKSITPTIAVSGTYTFTGSAITPAFTVKDGDTALTADDYTAVFADNINAGSGKVTVTEKTTGNYTFSEAQQSFTIGKAAAPTLDNISVSQKYTVTTQQSKDIGRAGMPDDAGTLAYAKGTEEEITYVSSWSVNNTTGEVTYTLSGGTAGDTVTLPIKITSTNYADSTVNVVITLTDKDVPTLTAPTANTLVYNGSAQALVTAGTTADGTMQYSLNNADWSDSVPTGKDAKTYTVYYKVVGDSNHTDSVPASVSVTIAPRSIADASVTLGESLTYNGSSQTQTVTVKLGEVDITSSCNVSNNVQTNAGSYTLTVTAKDNSNYTGSVTKDFTIAKKSITPTIAVSGTYTFTGSAITPAFTVKDGDTALTADDYTAVFADNINAGSGKVTVTEKTTGNYTFSEAQQSFTIGKAAAPTLDNISVSQKYTVTTQQSKDIGRAGMPDDAGTLAYAKGTEEEITYVSSWSVNNTTGEVTYTLSGGTAGDTVTLPIKITSTNYADSTVNVVITLTDKDVPTLTAPTANTLVYNGSAQALVTAGTTADGTMQYSLNNADWSDSVPTGKDAKTYTVYYKVVGDSNHTDSVPASVSVTIAPRSIADASVTLGESLTYNGSSQTQTVTVKLGEVDITSSCNVSNNVQTNAGSYTLTVTAKDNSNYTGSVTKDFTIAKKSITPTIAVSGTYTFTGSAITPAFTVKDGDTALTADDYTAVFADNINAGSGKVTVTEKTTGNYTFSEAQQSFTIGKAAAPTLDNISVSQKYTVTTQQSKDIGRAGMPDDAGTLAYAKGTEEEITYVSSWSVNNTTGEVTYTLSGGTAGDTVTLPIKITSTNYADSTVNVVITLTDKDVPTLTAPTANTLVYNGSAQALVTAGTTADGTMQYSLNNADWSDSVPTGKDAKTYTVYYKVVGDSNHTDSVPASVSVTIAPRSIADASVTLGESLTYNGSSQTQTVTVKLGEVDITSSCNVSNNVQTNAGSYTLTVTAKDGSNYTGSVTKDFTIAKKSITPTIEVSGTYTFTGSAITPAFTVKDGDTALTADDYTAVFADNINAGSGKVTVTEKTTGNYTFSEAQQSFTIGKAAAPTLDNISVSQKYTVTTQQSKDIYRAGMPDDAGTLAYAKGTEEEITYVSSWSVNNTTGEVTYTLSGGTAGDTVTLPIKITSTNYADSTVNVVITLTDKDVPTLTAPTANTLVYNGSAQALVTAGTTADGTMQYSLNNADWSDSVPTGKDAKTYTVYYKVVGDSNHTDSVPASVSVTIAPRSIADASVTLGESLTYNGSSQTQTVTVKLGEVDITSSCNVSNNVQTNAGSYTLTVTAKDGSNYTGSVTKDFTIAKKSITPTIEVSGTYTFTGSAITPAFTVKDGDTALTADDYTAVFADNINAGSGKVTVTEKTTGNYTFSEAQQSFTIGKAAAPTLDNISVSQKYTVTTQQSKDIGRAGMPDDAGTLAYAKGTEEEITYVSSWSVNNTTGEVTYTLSGGTAGDTVTLPIKITSTNYADSTVNVVITLTDKDVPTVNANDITVTYTGSAIPNNAITGTASVAGSWRFKNAAPVKVADSSDSVTVVFTPADTDTYETVEKTIKVTINKATPTGTPAYTAITTGGKTLADAALAIGTITPTGGSIAWDVAADTAVTANTAYNWTYTPADTDNYNNLTGSITPYVVSYSGGGSSGSSNTTTKTEKNPDGSTTTTVTDKKTGTVTETTKNTDGSTTVVETKKDGTVTETNKTADGTTGTVVTDKNGSVTEVKSTVSTAAAKEAAKTGEAVTLPVEVPAAKTTEDAPAVEISVPKSTGSVKVEIPVGKVTPGTVAVIVHADGTEEIVKTSIPTKTGVALKLEGSATVKVIDNAKKFSDVPASHWASEAVAFASARGITGGTSDTTFSPDTPCTRGQIVTFLWRAAGSPEPKGLSNLSDVPADAYYAKAVAWALENGITGGTGNGMFSPDATCTRSQSVTFLYRAAGSPTASDDIAFSDVTAESYYADAVAWAIENGITAGVGGGLFDPNATCTRAQIVTFLHRSYLSK